MNYLAHAYLSFHNPDILLGNMIADFIRGKQINNFRKEIQDGIILHRQIDEYTDNHPTIRRAKTLLKDSAGRYNASFLDISLDHYIALDTTLEPTEGWLDFSEWCYDTIGKYKEELPDDFNRFFSYMKKENWLYNYRYKWMIKKSFERLTRRAKFLNNNTDIFSDFEKNYQTIESEYHSFFPDLIQFTQQQFKLNSYPL